MKSIKELTTERHGLFEANKAMLSKAESEGRSLNSEERSEYDKRDNEIDKLSDELKSRTDDLTRKQRLDALQTEMDRPLPRQTSPTDPGKGNKSDEALTLNYGRAGSLSIEALAEGNPSVAESLRERSTAQYAKNFRKFLMTGEQLGLVVGDDVRGGVTAGTGFVSNFIKFLDDATPIRGLATVLPPTMLKSVGMLSYDTDYGDADWSAEVPASDITEDSAARFGGRELMPHLFSKMVKSSRKFLRNSSLAVEAFLAQRGAYKCAITENKAYLTGDGAQQPLGMFVASASGIPTTRDTACASQTTFTADELIDVQHSVKDAYRAKGSWIVSRTFRKMCRKLKDGEWPLPSSDDDELRHCGIESLLERPLVVRRERPVDVHHGPVHRRVRRHQLLLDPGRAGPRDPAAR
jgi:HK97 family phage major capsid protein